MSVLTIAAIQPVLRWLRPGENLAAVRMAAERAVSESAAAGRPVDVVVLPEAFAGHPPERGGDATAGDAERFLAELARSLGVVVIGGTVERRDERGRITNTCFVHDAAGAVIARYDKRMLFGGERDGRSAGDGTTVFELGSVRVGVLICADLWHPELARELRARVDVLVVPAKTTVESESAMAYARTLWHALALTRGMESGVAVVVSDWAAGPQEVVADASAPVKFTSGATTIVDPSGRPLIERVQQTIDGGGAGSIVATIDTEALAAYRAYRQRVGLLPSA